MAKRQREEPGHTKGKITCSKDAADVQLHPILPRAWQSPKAADPDQALVSRGSCR